jgi:LacI family transcriptional regulator
MHEVARHAGVAPMTVSRVLSGDAKVSEETRRRVDGVIKELGYSPNVAARNLARASPIHLGLLYNNPSAAYLNEFLVGALEQSARRGCQLVLGKCGSRNERQAIERLLADGVGGLILAPPLSDSSLALELVSRAKVPFVAIGSGRKDLHGISVGIDDFEAAAAMTRYLLSLGHRKIGFVIGAPNISASHARVAGFRAAMQKAGAAVQPEWIKQGDFTYRSGLDAAGALLAGEDRPTAIFASNDDMAAGAVAVAHRLGLAVPGDVTIVGFDDTPLASAMWPSLTTVRQPVAAMARSAVELLLEDMRRQRLGEAIAGRRSVLKHRLVTRESSAHR